MVLTSINKIRTPSKNKIRTLINLR